MKKIIQSFLLLIIFSVFWQPQAHARAPTADALQSGSVTFDNSNATGGCAVWAFIYQSKETAPEINMILSVSSSYTENPDNTQFSITFNFDQGTIAGSITGSYYGDDDDGGYDSADVFADFSNGTVSWDPSQNVWVFGGNATAEVYLDVSNMYASRGDEVFFGEAHAKTTLTTPIIGASGQHLELNHHGEYDSYGERFYIEYEGKDLPNGGTGDISTLTVDCWMSPNFGTEMQDMFPQGPGASLSASSGEQTEATSGGGDEVDLSNPNDQLGLFIATYGTDWTMLNQWPGWENLTDAQQINLQNLITRLDHILALEAPVSPLGLALLADEKREEIKAQQAADLIEEELEIRKNIRDTVWLETLGETFGEEAVELYQYFGIFHNIKNLYDSGVAWIDTIKDPDAASIDKVKQDAIKSAGIDKTPEDIAREAIGHINTIATAPSVYHFAYYCEVYSANTGPNPHLDALNALRTRVNDYAAGEIGDPNDRLQQMLWGPGTARMLQDKGIYDRAFQKINCDNPPLVKP